MDKLTPEQRSANMKAVRRRHTKPELLVRRALHAKGYRYRLHLRALPGSPDIVFTGRKKAIFVHGCFWHGHDCRAGRPPQTRQDYWVPKITRNRVRDAANLVALAGQGWRSMVVWECEITGRQDMSGKLAEFLGPPRGQPRKTSSER